MVAKLGYRLCISRPFITMHSSIFKKKFKTIIMPYINIKVTKENLSQTQKAKLIEGVTTVMENVLDKKKRTTIVIIDEVDTDNWGIQGEQVTVRREQNSK